MKQLLVSALAIGMAFACNNSSTTKSTDADTSTLETTPSFNREGNMGGDTSTLLPSDTSSRGSDTISGRGNMGQ